MQHQALQLHKAVSGGSERKRAFKQRRGKPFISLLCDNLGLHCGEQFYFILCLAALWHSIIFSSWIQLPLGTVDEWLAQLPSVDFLWIFTICFLDLMPLYVENENHWHTFQPFIEPKVNSKIQWARSRRSCCHLLLTPRHSLKRFGNITYHPTGIFSFKYVIYIFVLWRVSQNIASMGKCQESHRYQNLPQDVRGGQGHRWPPHSSTPGHDVHNASPWHFEGNYKWQQKVVEFQNIYALLICRPPTQY